MNHGRGTQLVKEVRELERRIEHTLASARNGARLRRRLGLELLGVLNGAGRFDLLPELVPRTSGLTERIEKRLRHKSNHNLARAIYANAFYGQSIESQLASGRLYRSEWGLVNRLARSLHVTPSYGQGSLEDPPEWMIDVDESHQRLRVWLREPALQDMLLAGLETFLVPAGSGRPSTEVYGIAFGSNRISRPARRRASQTTLADLNIERVCIQQRAEGSPSVVFTDKRSEYMQLAMAEELFPYWNLLGDFHTHTYKNLDQLLENRGWHYSRFDERVNIEWCARLRQAGHRPRVALILALSRAARRARRSVEAWAGNMHVLRTTIGDCHCFIAAYRIRPDGRYSTDGIELKCPHLAGR